MKTVFEKVFQLSKHKTTAKTEVMAGITTFMTMAYILAVNPSVLSAAGMDATAVLLATALSSFIGTAYMALMANLPFASLLLSFPHVFNRERLYFSTFRRFISMFFRIFITLLL